MSSSQEAKEFLSDEYYGNPSDWKRISKKKHNSCEVRVFENKNTSEKIELINCSGDEDFYTRDYFPTKFWIYLPEAIYDQLQDGTITEDYTSACEKCNDGFESNAGYKDPITVAFQAATCNDETKEIWHDQHVTWIMSDYYGANFSIFDEPCENCNILIVPTSLKDIRETLTTKGLKFLGYRVNVNH